MKKLLYLILAFVLITSNVFGASLEIDYMEYSSDAAAQAAYVTTLDSYTKLLLNCYGSDASTTFIDTAGKTVTANGSAQIDTAITKFPPSGSALFSSGTSDYLSVPASADFSPGSDNFTVDFWLYLNSTSRGGLFAFSSDYYFGLDFNSVGTNCLGMWATGSGTSWAMINADPGGNGIGTVPLGLFTWYHIALVRYGNNWRTYINGIHDTDITVSGTVKDASALAFWIGRWGNGAFLLNGQIAEFRFSKGIARWTNDFTPPIAPYVSLQSYSEATIKTQGSYALKAVAAITDSLNKTLTKTFAVNSNLTGVNKLRIDDYALRTGSNYKIGLHDTGGTTTEYTPNILSSNTWQTDYIDLSAVTDANKDNIDTCTITITNADSANTIILDYFGIFQGGGGGSYTWAN